MICSSYLILDDKGKETKNYRDIVNIVLPLIIYIMDIVECSLFYLEGRTFQLKGYTQLFQDISKLTKINFRLISIYYVISFAIYAFLIHHSSDYHLKTHNLDVIFLAIWFFSYFFIIASLCLFGQKFISHNRDKPKPDLFFPQPNNNNYIQNSPQPTNYNNNNNNQQTPQVIQKLYKDKATLMRQLDCITKKYQTIKYELQQQQQQQHHEQDAGVMIDTNDNNELKIQIQKLKNKLRSEREQIKTLSTQIDTKKALLDAQKSETQQLRNVLQAKDDRIGQLMNDKESLERSINACNDQKDDLLLLYQVKEQEVEIAKKENQRLRKKLQQTSNY